MAKKTKIPAIVSAVVLILGIVATVLTRSAALTKGAPFTDKLLFSCSLLLVMLGAIALIAALLPEHRKVNVKTLATAAMFAALSYIGFAYLRFDIPVGTEKTAFHLGNVFCVLGALFLGGFWGGMSSAIGLTIADLTSAYVTSAPKTFFLKLGIGLIAGLVAHKVFHLNEDRERKIPLPIATIISTAAGMAFNVVADPLVGYFYKMYILGVPQDIANAWAKMGAVTTSVNAIVAVAFASILYLALRPALKRANLMP